MDKCSRCEKPATGWIQHYFIPTGADLPLCTSHTVQWRILHPLGPEVSMLPSKKRKAARHGR